VPVPMTVEEVKDGESAPPPGTFLQSRFWAAFKESPSWKARRFILRADDGRVFPVLLMERRLRGPLGFAYVPRAPIPPDLLQEAGRALASRMPRGCLFIRFDLSAPLSAPDPGAPYAPGSPFRKAASDVQVPDTVLIDLSGGEDAVLAGMKPKWRYNVKLAGKKGVAVSCVRARGSSEAERESAVKRFYALYRETAERDRIALHGESYYRRLAFLAREREDAPEVRIWTASVEGEDIAMIVTLFQGKEAVYLYGASSNAKREYMPSYALQWEAMRAAMASGCETYDLFGIPPSGDEASSLHGLYRFKTGFGGTIVRYPGAWDLPLRPLAYAAFSAAERARAFYHKVLRKGGRRRGEGEAKKAQG